MELYADVVLDIPINKTFQYSIKEEHISSLQIGNFVHLPFGRQRNQIGCVVEISSTPKISKKLLKSIESINQSEVVIPQDILDITLWMSQYYHCAWGEALFASIPSVLRKKDLSKKKTIQLLEEKLITFKPSSKKQEEIILYLKQQNKVLLKETLLSDKKFSPSSIKTLLDKGILLEKKINHFSDATSATLEDHREKFQLNEYQIKAVDQITNSFHQKEHKSHLLWGITGSGKTEVYLQIIENVIKEGYKAIVLVPEISLTPQTLSRFKSRFQKIAVLHSHLTDNERISEWRRIADNQVDIVIGARSAIFAPIKNIGVIIVDEEHETSYKQDRTPRYNGRDIAVYRANKNNIPIVLGSATPSMESYNNAINGKYNLIRLNQRAGGSKIPDCHIVDLKKELTRNKKFEIFSTYLLSTLKDTMREKKQSLVFINRKGYYPHLSCKKCSLIIKCKQCEIGLTLYRKTNKASCNFCGLSIPVPRQCPDCQSTDLKFKGYGTERVTDTLQMLMPQARILRMDASTMTNSKKHEAAYLAFKNQEYDILVGTQMVAKGLDFPNITTVGILQVDASLAFLDFRMAEKTFQMISQVSGRAGRAKHAGKVIIQTFNPEHYVIDFASKNQFNEFSKEELNNRKMLFYPPYSKMVKILFRSKNEIKLEQHMNELAQPFRQLALDTQVQCLGPAPSGIEKLENEFRYQFIIKAPSSKMRHNFIQKALECIRSKKKNIQFFIDIDPLSTI